MPFVDLNTPTQVLFEWGWLLLTRANGLVFALIVVVFLLGAFVSLPEGKRRTPAPAAPGRSTTADGGDPA